jgi:hypothetical protein
MKEKGKMRQDMDDILLRLKKRKEKRGAATNKNNERINKKKNGKEGKI